MSIIHAFDIETDEIIKPSYTVAKVDNFPQTVVVTFSRRIFDVLLKMDNVEQISELGCGFATIPIYKINYKGKDIAIYTTMLGGAASAALLEEVIAKGGREFVFFGSCGTLDSEISAGCLIVPTAAYRDEGTSYHYLAPSDFIEITTADKLANILSDMELPCVKAKTWTTDAFYRETRKNMMLRKEEGCLSVEMECASVSSVCQFRNVEFYQYLFTEDNLDSVRWEKRIMGNLTQSDREKYLMIALEIAIRV